MASPYHKIRLLVNWHHTNRPVRNLVMPQPSDAQGNLHICCIIPLNISIIIRCRLAFIKSLRVVARDPNSLELLSNYWLGHYGLRLPENYSFIVGVASHPEAESASLEVPSCCVMTNLGLSVLPGSQPGGNCFNEAVGLLLEGLRTSEVQLMGGEGFKVESTSGKALDVIK